MPINYSGLRVDSGNSSGCYKDVSTHLLNSFLLGCWWVCCDPFFSLASQLRALNKNCPAVCNWGISDMTEVMNWQLSHVWAEKMLAGSSFPVDLTEETLMVTLKIQARTHKTLVFLPSWPYLSSVQLPQRIPLLFIKLSSLLGTGEGWSQ